MGGLSGWSGKRSASLRTALLGSLDSERLPLAAPRHRNQPSGRRRGVPETAPGRPNRVGTAPKARRAEKPASEAPAMKIGAQMQAWSSDRGVPAARTAKLRGEAWEMTGRPPATLQRPGNAYRWRDDRPARERP